MYTVEQNVKLIKQNIFDICKSINKNVDDITVIAVTKTVDTERIRNAISCGITNLGENKVQELLSKYDEISDSIKWHLIGHLQTNKVKYIIDKVSLIHSVDSINLAREIDSRALKSNCVKDILIQVNVAQEDAKFGISLNEVDTFINEISNYSNIRIKGLMTIAPFYDEIEKARPIFRALKEKFEQLKQNKIKNVSMDFLSMGMTGDYKQAIQEGSNMVRIGTGIFGHRNYSNQEV